MKAFIVLLIATFIFGVLDGVYDNVIFMLCSYVSILLAGGLVIIEGLKK